jgi:hypothetical protein
MGGHLWAFKTVKGILHSIESAFKNLMISMGVKSARTKVFKKGNGINEKPPCF